MRPTAARPDPPVPAPTATPPLLAEGANTARSSLVVSAGFLITALLGGGLSILVTLIVGEGAETDSFFAAYSIYLFFVLFGSTLRVSLVPLLGTPADEDAWRRNAADTVGRINAAALLVTAVVVVASPLLARALTPGLPSSAWGTTTLSLALLAAASSCQIVAAALAATLAATRRFIASTALFVSSTALTVVLGCVAMLLIGVTGAAIGVLVGSVAHMGGHVLYLRRFGLRLGPRLRGVAERRTWRLTALASAGAALAVAQQGQVSVALAAVSSQVGAVTAYTYGYFIATLLASVTVYAVAYVMLPGAVAGLQEHGDPVARDYLRVVVPMAAYLFVPLAAAFALFGRPALDAVFGDAMSASSLDLLWDVARIFLLLTTAFVVLAPLSTVVLALERRSALVLPALAVVPVQIVAVAIASSSGPVAVAAVHAAIGAALPIAVGALAFGRRAPGILAGAVVAALPVALLAAVFPAALLVFGEPATLLAAVALSALTLVGYALLGTFAWPSIGGRAARMLLARG